VAAVNLIGSYNYALVSLSVLIAMLASYAALDLAGRVTAAGGWTRAVWLLAGLVRWELAFGPCTTSGCWRSSYRFPCTITGRPCCCHCLRHSRIGRCAVRGEPTENGCVPSGRRKCPDGCGIASMHYIGMAAMRLPAMCQFNSFLVVLSVVFAF